MVVVMTGLDDIRQRLDTEEVLYVGIRADVERLLAIAEAVPAFDWLLRRCQDSYPLVIEDMSREHYDAIRTARDALAAIDQPTT